ncbi:hypothetical protein Gpo141_00009994 [Globisporangium polare]
MNPAFQSSGSTHRSTRSNLPSHQRYALTQLLSDQELYENTIQVLPNLRAVSAAQGFFGPSWKSKSTRHNVTIHEYDNFSSSLHTRPRAMSTAGTTGAGFWAWARSPSARSHGSIASLNPPPSYGHGSSWPDVSAGVPYAAVARCTLNCNLEEAIDALFSNEEIQHESSMRALWGKKYKRGDQLRSQPFKRDLRSVLPSDHFGRNSERKANDHTESGWIGVNTAVLAPHGINLAGKHDRTQRLCFSSYTQKSTTKNEAVFLMKTLPKDLQYQLIDTSDRSALRGGIDHIAVGYHLTGHYNEITGHQTRLVMSAYVSSFSGNERPEVMQWRMGLHDASDSANSEAKYIVMMLAKATRKFESVIRRRRLGQHPFIYVMAERASFTEPNCGVCDREFGFVRRAQFCQLCGHLVCRSCSQKYEVEPLSGGVRKNRVCYTCAGRIHSGAFKPQQSLGSKKSTVSSYYETIEEADDDDDYYQGKRQKFDRTLVLPVDDLQSPKPGHQLAEALFSPHPLDRARALEVLKKAVKQVTEEKPEASKPLDPVLIGKYLEAKQRLTNITSNDFSSDDFDSGRSFPVFYQQSFGSGHSVGPDNKERRFFQIEVENDLPSFDGDGLDAICEVAAQRMKCPMAFVSVLGRDEQHIVGAFQVAECLYRLPRNQSIRSNGLLADGQPLVVKNPTQDVRFRRMPIIHEAGIQFFAGFPIKDRSGNVVASLCTVDTLSHDNVSHDDISAMAALTKLAADVFNGEEEAPVPITPRMRY